jgi:putative ABC transport system ATP-binding protein
VLLEVQNVSKTYRKGDHSVHALQHINLQVESGEFVIVHGASGSGKSTLLLMLGGMLRPNDGNVLFRGTELYRMRTFQRARFRRRHVGFLFQKFFLLPHLTAQDNIRLAQSMQGGNQASEQEVRRVADRLGIDSRLHHHPFELSVGEQQRVAMARAVAGNPDLLLADEPTGNLDRQNRTLLAEFLTEQNRRGRTIVVVTHDESLMELGSRAYEMSEGRLCSDEISSH